MRILVVAHFQNDGSPTAIFIHNQLKAYVAAGHSVRVIVPLPIGKRGMDGRRLGAGIQRQVIDGIEHFFLRYLSFSKFGATHFNTHSAVTALRSVLPQVLEGFPPDVIHAHTLGLDSSIGVWMKSRLHVPLVVTTHGSDASIPIEQGKSASLKSLCDWVDIIVAVSPALAKKLRTCGTTVPVASIINGFASENTSSDNCKLSQTLLQVGHLAEQKRVSVTIRAFAEIRKRYPGATLTLIGQGPERANLEALCRKLDVSGAVQFLGQVSNGEVMAEMAKSQIFVMPSVREGFGIVYLEAMASGCVTIGTQGEGIDGVIVSDENGFLVPPDNPDAIVEVVDRCFQDEALMHRIADAGKATAMTMTWENNAKQYTELFESLIKKDPS